MWNYSYVFPSVLVLLVLLTHYFMTPRLKLRVNRSFLALLIVELLTLVTDLAATRADELFLSFSVTSLYILNIAFFICYFARAFYFFLFTLDVLRLSDDTMSSRPNPLHAVVFALSELVALSSFATGALFRIDEAEGYQRGPLYFVLYICWFFYLGLSLWLVDKHVKKLDRYSYISLLAYNIVLMAGNVARILLPRYLVMNTFCLLAILIIYLAFENPDLYLANRRIAFSMRAFRAELADRVGKQPYHVLAFALRDYVSMRELYGGLQMDRGIDLIATFLIRTYPQYQAFYLRNGCFALLGDETMPWEQMRSHIAKRFQAPWQSEDMEMYLDISFVQIGSEAQITSADRVVTIISSAMAYAEQAVDNLIDLNANQDFKHQSDIKRALENALEANKLEIFLQPLVDSKTRLPVGAEVLSRIRDDDGRIIPPNRFVPIAEKNGKVNQMGEQMLEKACRFLHEHGAQETGLAWLNINLSPVQCMKRDLNENFLAILSATGISPEMIHLEIAERSVNDIPMLEEHIQTLRESGFCFSLDDYGRGFSNLNRIKHLPFVNIKLDVEAVWSYFHEQDQLLPGIVRAFREMGYTVTAEGIESEEMADAMTAIGCDYLQGFYFSRPLSTDEYLKKYGRPRA